MLIALLAVLAVLSPVVAGGRLVRLARVEIRGLALPVIALVTQVVIISVLPQENHHILSAVHIVTYVVAGLFIVVNRAVPGLWLIGLGAGCNGLAIAANGGVLPASADAMRRAGWKVSPQDFINSGVLPHPRLAFLGDNYAWPAPLPLANTFSVGDVLVVLGALYAAHRICGSVLARWVDRLPRVKPIEQTVLREGSSVYWWRLRGQPRGPQDAYRGRHRPSVPV